MLPILLLGVASSLATELVTKINKHLQGTVLDGRGALLLSFVIALIGAAGKTFLTPGFDFHVLANYQTLADTFSTIWTTSQIFFVFVVKTLKLNVDPITDTMPTV